MKADQAFGVDGPSLLPFVPPLRSDEIHVWNASVGPLRYHFEQWEQILSPEVISFKLAAYGKPELQGPGTGRRPPV
ncbi:MULTISPECIES: hypothetical protein [unclassified Paenibacillus]|uniref:hypothetical protein n=1 Tax=unclassified Paenibacillus TaxID=185978 RepID=UPI0030FAC0BB